jgi:hypothetical protein
LYRKGKEGWQPIDGGDLLDQSALCKALVDSLVYRQLKPQHLGHIDDGTISQDGISDTDISIDENGLVFSYEQYSLGAYAEGPWPVHIAYKSLGRCFRGFDF